MYVQDFYWMNVSASQVQQGSPSSVSSVNTEHSSCSLKPAVLHMLHKATQVLALRSGLVGIQTNKLQELSAIERVC